MSYKNQRKNKAKIRELRQDPEGWRKHRRDRKRADQRRSLEQEFLNLFKKEK